MYSTYNYEVKRITKTYGIPFTKLTSEVLALAKKLGAATMEDAIYDMWRLLAEDEILNGGGVHIFIKGETLFNFLLETEVKTRFVLADVINRKATLKKQSGFYANFTGSNRINLIVKKGETPNDIANKLLNKSVSGEIAIQEELISLKSGIIHHNSKKYDSFLFILIELKYGYVVHLATKDEHYQSTYLNYDDYIYKSLQGMEEYTEIPGVGKVKNDMLQKDWDNLNRVFFNMLYYCECFPDKIQEGVPEDFRKSVFDPTQYKKNISLSMHESLVDRSGITPHFRKGHFAHLESDRYVNKKGQIVWRSASMVKGFQAKTVIE